MRDEITIDLTRDAVDLHATISAAVKRYTAKHRAKRSATAHPPVTRIDLNFWLGDGGPVAPFVLLQFDTRPDAKPDGSPTYPNFATLRRPHWKRPIEAVFDGKSVRTIAGERTSQLTNRNLAKSFGEFFVNALKAARATGVWDSLPMAANCKMGVEESGGNFGWPDHAKRGRDNWAVKGAVMRRSPVVVSPDAAVDTALTRAEPLLQNWREATIPVAIGALAALGTFAESHPERVWLFIERWGRHRVKRVRWLIAYDLLRPLLAHHFDDVFPKVRLAAFANDRFADTYLIALSETETWGHRLKSRKKQTRLRDDLNRRAASRTKVRSVTRSRSSLPRRGRATA